MILPQHARSTSPNVFMGHLDAAAVDRGLNRPVGI